jgi:hypothetical protein
MAIVAHFPDDLNEKIISGLVRNCYLTFPNILSAAKASDIQMIRIGSHRKTRSGRAARTDTEVRELPRGAKGPADTDGGRGNQSAVECGGSDSDGGLSAGGGTCIASSAMVCQLLPADGLPSAHRGGGGGGGGLIGVAGLLSAAQTAADSSDFGEDVQLSRIASSATVCPCQLLPADGPPSALRCGGGGGGLIRVDRLLPPAADTTDLYGDAESFRIASSGAVCPPKHADSPQSPASPQQQPQPVASASVSGQVGRRGPTNRPRARWPCDLLHLS